MSPRRHACGTVALILTVLFAGLLTNAPLLSTPATVHAQTLGTAAVQTPDGPELITTGSFEHGLDGWQASTRTGTAFATAGQAYGVGAQLCHAARCHDELSTQVQLPSPAQQSFLSYRFRVDSSDSSRVCNDRLYTELRTQSGSPIATVGVACNFDTNGWQYRRTEVSAALTPYAGQVVQVVFVGSTAGSTPTGFTVDDVHLTARPMPLLTHQPAPRIHPLRGTRHATSLRHPVPTPRHHRTGRFHDQVSMGPQEQVQNGGFETGSASPWTNTDTTYGQVTNTAAHSGSYSYQLCNTINACSSTLTQTVTLPRTPTHLVYSFSALVNSGGNSTACLSATIGLPGGGAYYPLGMHRIGNGNIQVPNTICNTNGQWSSLSIDVSQTMDAYGGRPIQLIFAMSSPYNDATPGEWYVDDVSLQATYDQPAPGTKQLLDNNNFDTGSIFPWTMNNGAYGPSHLDTNQFHSAFYSLSFCGVANATCDDLATQSVALPNQFTSASLSFWVRVTTQKTSGCPDTLVARITFGGSSSTAQTVCNQTTNGWVQETADVSAALTSWGGQLVQLQFESTCPNGCPQPTQFWIDDVQLNVTGAPTARWTGGNDTSSGAPAWWSFAGISPTPLIGLSVNLANGNLLASMGQTSSQGVNGLDQGVSLRYNSASRGTITDLGYGWGFDTSRDVGLDVPSPTSTIVFHDGSGSLATFTRNSDGSYSTPPGLNAQLVATIDGGYTLTKNSSQEQLQFDSNGYLTAEQNRTGQRLTYTYNFYGSPNSSRDTEGRVTKFYENNLGHIVQLSDAVTRPFTYAYDGSVNLQTVGVIGPNNTTRTYTLGYDGNHDLTSITDPLGNQTQLRYVNNGGTFQVASITRINSTTPVNPTWTFSYSSGSTTVTDPNQHSTTYAYDSLNRVTAVTDPNQHISHTTWNSNNDVTQEFLPSGTATTYTYSTDGRNNLTGMQLANGASESYGYSDPNWPYQATSHTDAENNTTSLTYGSPNRYGAGGNAGQVTAVTDALGHQSSATYTQDGTVNSSTGANGSATATYYNYTNTTVPNYGVALPNGISPPAPLGTSFWQYNGDNQVSVATDGMGQVSTYGYDELGRPAGVVQQGGNGFIHNAYDAAGNQISMQDATASNPTMYTLNNLYQETRKTLPSGQQIQYSYDGVDNLLSKSDQSGTTAYTYDPAGNLKTVSDPYQQQTRYSYDQDGQQTQVDYPNGLSEATQYDTAGNISTIHGFLASNPNAALTSYSYGYGIPNTYTTTTQPYSMTDNVTGNTTSYQYDAHNRLTGVNQPWSGSGGNYLYGYDNNGNMTSSAFGGATPTSMSYNNVDQLTSSTAPGNPSYGYDANGNQLSVSGGNSMSYNWLGQTSSITPNGGSAINATFAGGGQSERLSNGSTNYQYDGTGLSTSTDSGGNRTSFTNSPRGTVVSENIPVGQPGCMGAGGAVCTYYYLHDGSGSTMALVDSRGAVTNHYAYDPWGKTITGGTNGTVPNPFRYDGAMLDPQTGLYKMSRRYYDPTTGRFLQRGSGSQPYACKDGRGAAEDTCGEDEEFLLTRLSSPASTGTAQNITIQVFARPQENGDISFVLRVLPNGSRLTGVLAEIRVVVNGHGVDYGRLLSNNLLIGNVRHAYTITTQAMYVGNGLIAVSVTVQNFTLEGALGPNYYVNYVFCLNVEHCPYNYQNP